MNTSVHVPYTAFKRAPNYPALSSLVALIGRPLWIIDLEATTGDTKDPEFGVVATGDVLVQANGSVTEDSYLLDPKQPMSPYAAHLTSISTEDYTGQPGVDVRWTSIEPMLLNCIVSVFGVHDLDCKALFEEAQKHEVLESTHFKIDSIDARSLWRIHSGVDKDQRSQVAALFGHVGGHPHQALDDARAAASALEGLLFAMGIGACAQTVRKQWNPLESVNQADRETEILRNLLTSSLLVWAGCGDFSQGIALMEVMGLRVHLSTRGISWWSHTTPPGGLRPSYRPTSCRAFRGLSSAFF